MNPQRLSTWRQTVQIWWASIKWWNSCLLKRTKAWKRSNLSLGSNSLLGTESDSLRKMIGRQMFSKMFKTILRTWQQLNNLISRHTSHNRTISSCSKRSHHWVCTHKIWWEPCTPTFTKSCFPLCSRLHHLMSSKVIKHRIRTQQIETRSLKSSVIVQRRTAMRTTPT